MTSGSAFKPFENNVFHDKNILTSIFENIIFYHILTKSFVAGTRHFNVVFCNSSRGITSDEFVLENTNTPGDKSYINKKKHISLVCKAYLANRMNPRRNTDTLDGPRGQIPHLMWSLNKSNITESVFI